MIDSKKYQLAGTGSVALSFIVAFIAFGVDARAQVSVAAVKRA